MSIVLAIASFVAAVTGVVCVTMLIIDMLQNWRRHGPGDHLVSAAFLLGFGATSLVGIHQIIIMAH